MESFAFTSGQSASIVIGQSTFTTNTAGASATALANPFGISFDSTGNLWLADNANTRVLMFPKGAGFTNGEAATIVIGQGSFTTNTIGTTETTLSSPKGISFDSAGNLWVTDSLNNRVLMFPKGTGFTNGEAATIVIGQSTFATAASGVSATAIFRPQGIAIDSSGNLWVIDFNNRVLMFPKGSGFTNGEAATTVIGQSTFTTSTSGTSATALNPSSPAFDSAGNLWIADFGNNRALMFAATISQVTGQLTVIAGSCGINVVSGAPINYGSLTPGSISTEQTVVLQNTGTVAGTLAVHGTDWLDGSSTSQILVGNTKFSTGTGTYASKTALTTSDQTVGTINPTPNLSTFWQLQANLLSSSFSGSLTQTVTFSNSC